MSIQETQSSHSVNRGHEIVEAKLDGAEPNLLDSATPLVLSSTSAGSVPFSVLICTCNRGASIVETVKSIFATHISCAELIIVDQSDTHSTKCALAPFCDDPRLRYIRSNVKGKGAALNRGLKEARHNIVAITDDDVTVDPEWPQRHLEAFARYPKIVLTYGNVLPVEFDASAGFIPTYYVTRDRMITNLWQKFLARGIGANTAVRRDAILELGGFDPMLGPGGHFKSCIDIDMTVRCIISGHHVYEAHNSKVYHDGFRNWEQGKTLIRNAFYGIGATYIKAVKCGSFAALVLLLWELLAYALFPALYATLLNRPPRGWNRIVYFLRGVWDGLHYPVDRKHLLYKIKSES